MTPLHGVALTGPVRLRLLVASNPPELVDVDTGARTPVTGLPAGADRPTWVTAVGQDAVITSSCLTCDAGGDVYVLRRGTTVARRIAAGSSVVASPDGRGVWLTRYDGTTCTLQEVALDGQTRTASRPVDCHVVPRAVTGRYLLTGAATGDGALVLTDVQAGSRTTIRRPTAIGDPSDGLASPDNRYLAIAFEHPAWPGPTQRLDLWLLEPASQRWQQAPSMPVPAALKFTAMTWLPDGRLVLLGDFEHVGQAVAVWRPGEDQFGIRTLALPEQRAEAFVVWPS
ncbi:hypothetical protein Pme01_19700 [Planosporangium mesophilum]|uniref:WD40 repeat domain-containing protein n=2 Tax=Planosporangium mesophilum TaxID=689768 RepID=A0A8J3T9K6_9ACTN|nr:hypothetical protein Pme01_19700 [Planosporangium mesophilum]